MEDKIKKLRILSAAYEASLEYDYCPDPEEAATYPEEFETNFSEQEFRDGAAMCKGSRPSEIINKIIQVVQSL